MTLTTRRKAWGRWRAWHKDGCGTSALCGRALMPASLAVVVYQSFGEDAGGKGGRSLSARSRAPPRYSQSATGDDNERQI